MGYVEYRDGNYLNSETVTHNPRVGGVYAREIEFPKYIVHNVTGKYVYAGSMILHLSSNTKVSDFGAYAAYGYSTVKLTGIGVSYPAGLSIAFGNGINNAGSAYAYLVSVKPDGTLTADSRKGPDLKNHKSGQKFSF